ncbi:hypothetical protein EIP91_009362 [Steccherinum ochraceum]|uniref:Uncharacterized protein n=1 Tax=Steccherinum ochraceum TaxID=92696 RepID=A0A4R0RP74_9APHY|nr:hypothetical protein EIP91_009362 [Steccherinum ochraceum]
MPSLKAEVDASTKPPTGFQRLYRTWDLDPDILPVSIHLTFAALRDEVAQGEQHQNGRGDDDRDQARKRVEKRYALLLRPNYAEYSGPRHRDLPVPVHDCNRGQYGSNS